MASRKARLGPNQASESPQSAEPVCRARKKASKPQVSDSGGGIDALARVADALAREPASRRETSFQDVIQHMPDGVILIDRDLNLLAINSACLKMLNISPDACGAISAEDLISIVVNNLVEGKPGDSALERCLAGQRVENEERHLVFEDGSQSHQLVNGAPIRDSDGEVEMALVVARDVTELVQLQIRTQEMLSQARRQQSSMRQIINHLPAGVMLLDSQLRTLAANKTYAQYFDKPSEWREGAHIEDVLPRATECGLTSLLQEALDTNRPVKAHRFRYEGFSKGVTFWSGSAVPMQLHFEDGPLNGVALVALDVTEEVSTQQRLEELAALAEHRAAETDAERARLNTIVEAVPIPLIVFDKQWNIAIYNSAALKLARHIGVAELLLQHGCLKDIPDLELTDAEGRVMDMNDFPLSRSLRGEICSDVIVGWQTQPGDARHFCINTAPLRDARGQVTGVVYATSDITEQLIAQKANHETYLREHAVSDKLQRSYAPDDFPDLERFDIAARYHPALDEAFVGGDFYDVFELGEGRFGIVMADVAGKGLKSAVYTSMAKYMLRAYSTEECAPELVMPRLNDALTRYTPTEVFITLIYGILDIHSATFTYANAGHEQPMFYSIQEGAVTLLDVTGRALALIGGARYTAHTVKVCKGDVLLLYTDGITDAGSGSHRFGHDRVMQIMESGASCSASGIAQAIRTAALEFAGGRLSDDAAILVIKAFDQELK